MVDKPSKETRAQRPVGYKVVSYQMISLPDVCSNGTGLIKTSTWLMINLRRTILCI